MLNQRTITSAQTLTQNPDVIICWPLLLIDTLFTHSLLGGYPDGIVDVIPDLESVDPDLQLH